MALATGALYLAARALPAAPCWSLFFLVALLAWPIWYAQAEYALFARRAVLAGAFVDDSRVRRWLWAGRVTRVVQVIFALAWATLLLGMSVLLHGWQWVALAVDTLLLALLLGPVRRSLAGEVRFEHAGLVARRWPLTILNVTLLALAWLVIDFQVVGAPDTRGLTWPAVFDRAWAEAQAATACPLAGALAGFLSAVERLSWHAAEVLIPSLPHPELKYAAWAAFLLQGGLLAYGFTRLQLGAAALAEQRERRARGGGGAFAPAFWVTLLLLAALWLFAAHRLEGFDTAQLQGRARQSLAWANPCKPDVRAVSTAAASSGAEVEAARAAAHRRADEQIAQRVGVIFEEAQQGVDRYLDWYFTVLGEYERLGALAAGELDAMMVRELEKHLFGDGMLGERLERASMAIGEDAQAQMRALATRVGLDLRERVRGDPCGLGSLDLSFVEASPRDVGRAFAAAGGGAMVGAVAVRSLGRKVATTAAARSASKRTFRVASGLVGKAVTKRGGSLGIAGAAAAMCAPGGPLALVCGLVAGAVSWLALDKAFIRIDEALFRDEMRAEILASLAEQQAELTAALRQQHHAAIDQMAGAVAGALDQAFIPARHGV